MPEKVRVALVGCGKMGQHHLNELSRVETPHEVIGFYDYDAVAAKKLALAWNAPVYDSITQLCEEASPDVVHICTPPDFHFEQAMEAIEGGASIYIEKPFVQTSEQARTVLDAASKRNVKACAGFQQVHDPAFLKLIDRSADMGQLQVVESRFAFNPARFSMGSATQAMLGDQLLDILPHPLYTLVRAIEQLLPSGAGELKLEYVRASPEALFTVLEIETVRAELNVSLIARPVESSIRIGCTGGSLTADFVRGIVHGTRNDGTQALEKILNPALEGTQLQFRSFISLVKRLLRGENYPGLARLIDSFYSAIANDHPSPISPQHILSVVNLYEILAENVQRAVNQNRTKKPTPLPEPTPGTPTIVVTGAGGLLGSRICAELVRRNFSVRAIGRTDKSGVVPAHAWYACDLSKGVPEEALRGAHIVIHAAAETSGGFEEHQRNSIDATNHLLEQANHAGVERFLFVSSLAVLEPRWWRSTPLNENSQLVVDPESMGPYIWGKSMSELSVANKGQEYGIDYCIVRPAALVDYSDTNLPGRLGKKLFGRWHLCLGRGGLPFAACDVDTAGRAIAWYAEDFKQAPRMLNLIDNSTKTRAQLLARYRQNGWDGRSIWVPISILASAIWSIKWAIGILKGNSSGQVSAWKVLKPRSYDSSLARGIIDKSSC